MLHIRIHTQATIGEVAEILVEHGCDEPDFETVDTRFGRMHRLRLVDEGEEIVITRVDRSLGAAAEFDLVTGRKTEVLSLEELSEKLDEGFGSGLTDPSSSWSCRNGRGGPIAPITRSGSRERW